MGYGAIPDQACLPPGLMLVAPSSGGGKTTLTLGLLRGLARRGLAVQPFKNGPDYIDPAFHTAAVLGQTSVAAPRQSWNLDSWSMPTDLLDRLVAKATGADLIIAEGSMGLFDGVSDGLAGANGKLFNGSSADLARRYGWPVVLVLDVRGQAQTAAAMALGVKLMPGGPRLAGVILNQIGSDRHERLARQAIEDLGIPVFGALRRNTDLSVPERHLGLVQASETADLDGLLDRLADHVMPAVDVDALISAAGRNGLPAAGQDGKTTPPPAARIAVARDAAFGFVYPHLLDGWQQAGAEITLFSPLNDEAPPNDAGLIWLPGGYPELWAGRLAACETFLSGLQAAASRVPVHGECGGFMVLGQAIIDASGERYPMAGLLGHVTSFAKRRLHLGYRRARLLQPMAGWTVGNDWLGHEFHYSSLLPGDGPADDPLARITDANNSLMAETGSRRGLVSGTYFHLIASVQS